MHVCAKMRSGRMGEQDEGECRDMSVVNAISIILGILNYYIQLFIRADTMNSTYLSISLSFSTSKLSSQPTSISTFTPPSNSSSDCDAGDADCAPSRGVKLNMVVAIH